MFEEKIKELQNDKEFMKKLAAVQDEEGYLDLFNAYGVALSKEEASDMHRSVLEIKEEANDTNVELEENDLDSVTGGFASVVIFGVAVPKLLVGTMLALVATAGVAHAVAKIKKKIREMGY